MINIAIDANEANVTQRVGSNAYAFELIQSMEKLLRDREEVTVEVLLSSPAVSDMPPARVGWRYVAFGPAAFWTQWALPWYLFNYRKKYDVLFTPGHYAPRFSAIPYVSSVMDLAYLHFPKQFRKKDQLQLSEWTRYSVKHAKKVVAISNFTKQEMVSEYKMPPDKIVVAYPGISSGTQEPQKEKQKLATLQKWGINRPYLLYVGTLQPRKNLEKLIEAFELVIEQEKEESKSGKQKRAYAVLDSGKVETLQLVIAGKVGWLADSILARVEKSPLKKRIVLTNYITDSEKNILYKEAVASILVGTYEGFGIPPLEAMAAGTIPIVSSTSSLPEVVGEAGVQVDPANVKSIAQGIKKVLVLPAKERAKMLKKGRQQMKKFSWDISAEVVLVTLFDVIAEKRVHA